MADCCQELKAELANLKAEIAKLQGINEQSIIDKAVKQASQLFDPKLVAIGFVASGAAAKAAEATAKASRFAGVAASLSKLIPIAATLAGLAASTGTIKLLEARSDGLENYIDSVSSDLSKLYGIVSKHDGAIKHIRGTANNALIKADRALGKFPGIESTIADLKAAIKHVRGTANDALIVARRAMAKFPTLEATIEHVRGTANDGLIVARRAEAQIKNVVSEFNAKLNDFEQGVRLIHADFVGRLRIAVIYFTETINGIQGTVYKTLDIHSREIYRFNSQIAGLNSRIQYIVNSYVPTYVKTAIGSLERTVENLKTRLNNLGKGALDNITSDLPNLIRNTINNSPVIKNLSNQVNNVTNVTNTYVTNVVNNVTNNTVTSLSNRVGTLENQLRNNEKVNEQANSSLDALKLLVLALPATLASNQTFQNAAVTAAAAGSCKSLSRGGCSSSPLPKMENDLAGANTKLDLLLQGGQTALLAKIDRTTTGMAGVLGTKIHIGGISGALGRFMSSSVVDRTLNLVTAAGVIHNCLMLSTSIQDTFFGMLDNIVAIPSLIKDPDGATIDTKEIFSKHLDKVFSGLFGAEEWKAIKIQWAAYSTIARTATNMFSNVRDIIDETSQIQVTTSNWVAQLGNGLTDEGVIGEDNWEYKDPNQRPKGKYFGRLERIREGLEKVENVFEDLEQVTSSVRNIVETANEIKENANTINKAIDDANKAAQKDRDAKVEGLELPNFSIDDLF